MATSGIGGNRFHVMGVGNLVVEAQLPSGIEIKGAAMAVKQEGTTAMGEQEGTTAMGEQEGTL